MALSIRDALKVVADLEATGVVERYAVCGALAAFYYLEPAATEDLDILISFDTDSSRSGLVTLGPILSALAARGYNKFHKEGILVSGFPVQFVPVADELDREALAEAVDAEIPFPGQTIFVRLLTAEHLACLALRTGRPKDKIRLSEFLARNVLDPQKFDAILARHGLSAKYRSFIQTLGQ